MTSEEEPALKDMVSQTLDARGVLPKIRAELRANVFLALEETSNFKEILTDNTDLTRYAQTDHGSLVLNLIREFLHFFNLDFTLSVFNPETRCNSIYNEMNRTQLLKSLAIDEDAKVPLLCQLLNLAKNSGKLTTNFNSPATALNTTYTKDNVSFETTPVRSAVKENEEPSSISTESVSEMNENGSDKSSCNDNSNSGRCTPNNEKQDASFNLLVFTPVQQVKTVPKIEKVDANEKASRESIVEETSKEGFDKPSVSLANGEGKKTGGMLHDLPPLNNRQQNINEIRQLLEKGLLNQDQISNNSQSSKSNKSKSGERHKDSTNHSEDNTVDDDDISELLNSHGSDGQLTEDETLSKVSSYNHLDHVESV